MTENDEKLAANDPLAGPHALPIKEVLRVLSSDRAGGLRDEQIGDLRSQHGWNELVQAEPEPAWRKFAAQFRSLVVWILIVAAVISGAMAEWIDTVAILAIVLLNGVLGYLQEAKAQHALAALQKLSAPLAKVVRGGQLQSLPARGLVPGDRIELEAGDYVPADARLIEAFALKADEAALTGESVPVEKDAHATLDRHTPLGDRRNMVFLGTVVSAGKASAVVTSTGMKTELGRIAGLLGRYEPEPTPLQRRLEELGKVLVVACLALVAVIFGLQMLRGGDVLEVLLLSISLAVAAVPEGLPAVVTMALALGLQRMVKRNALIRKLPSVETLGSVTVICSDKTGTLTRNEMTVRAVVAGDTWFDISGTGYSIEGEFRKRAAVAAELQDGSGEPVDPASDPDLQQALTIAARCNSARLVEDESGSRVVGDPTEGALLVAARKAGTELKRDDEQPLHEVPFDSQRKAMSVIYPGADGSVTMYTKGAPEIILAAATREQRGGQIEPLTEDRRKRIDALNQRMAATALRVLAVAFRTHQRASEKYEETDLVFAGLIGMMDPPREEAGRAVERCHQAGIRPVMITGDHPATALAIARELGIAGADERAVTGQELDQTSDDELARGIDRIAVFARVSAEHKLRVVECLKRRGEVVAMTGDGVNDGPAVKAADIGIAMGISGTDVTKEASDMVLTDDNFASIVSAVEEGRGIFDNIQKFIFYLLSTNAGEVIFMFLAALLGWPAPLEAIQILWINLVTDGLPALALAMEPPERDIMQRPPRPPREPVITWSRGAMIVFYGLVTAVVTAAGFWWTYQGDPANLDDARVVAFAVMAFSQLTFSFACRSQRYTLPELGLLSNPYLLGAIAISALLQLAVLTLPMLEPVFAVSAPPTQHWLMILLLALTPVTVIEMVKLARAAWRRVV